MSGAEAHVSLVEDARAQGVGKNNAEAAGVLKAQKALMKRQFGAVCE
jgi:hypothetical protein